MRIMKGIVGPYLFSVAHDDVIDFIPARKAGETLVDFLRLVYAEEAPLRLPKQAGVVLDGVGFCGGVDDAEHLLQMCFEELQQRAPWT